MADIYVATAGDDSTGDGSSGNPYATVGKACSEASGGDRILVAPGTYLITAVLAPPNGSAGALTEVLGYSATPGDLDDLDDPTFTGFPVIEVNNASITGIFNWGAYVSIRNLVLDGGSGGSGPAYGLWGQGGGPARAENCWVTRCGAGGAQAAQMFAGHYVGRCLFTAQRSGADCALIVFGGEVHGCRFAGNPCAGLRGAGGGFVHRCVMAGNTGSDGRGARTDSGDVTHFSHCVFYGNAQSGLSIGSTARVSDSVFSENGAYGVTFGTTQNTFPGDRNAYYANTSGEINNAPDEPAHVTLSADPFTDAAGGDFSLNDDAGGGAMLRGAAL